MALSRNVTLRVRQLAMFQPSNALLVWRAESVQIPQNMVNGMSGFRSVGPLMGGASFNLQLPKSASGLYIAVREWRGAKQTYLRIDNLFRPETMWSFGVNQETARPHPGRHRFQILPDVWNRFDVRWTNNSFQVSLNGVGVSNLRQRHPNDDSRARAAPPLSEVCIWVFGRLRPQERLPLMQALPSCILLNAEVHCCICDRNYTLSQPRWAVCSFCDTWVCRSHVKDTPFRLCPRCPMQLGDYLGGSDPTTLTSSAYKSAVTFWEGLDLHEAGDPTDKPTLVICGLLRRHRQLITLLASGSGAYSRSSGRDGV